MRRGEEIINQRYIQWKEKNKNGIQGINEENSKIILNYVSDMEYGLNIGKSSKKGGRSCNRLYNLQQRMVFITKKLEELYNIKDLTQLEERTLHHFFTGMKNGEIKRLDGNTYQDPANFVKVIKAFWHWWQKVNRKKGIEIYDITQDLDTSVEKPIWVYLTDEEIKLMYDEAIDYYKTLILFLYDTGVRAPSELRNIKVSDLQKNGKELNIRDEISKTFGRRIKLMMSSEIIKAHIQREGLAKDDYLFNREPQTMNKYLQRLAKKVFKKGVSPAGEEYYKITMYDFRHCSCCYWLPRYKSENALKYKFGWKKSDKIHYYSEFLGMKDTINEDDLYIDVTKTELEKEIADLKEKSVSKEDVLKLVKELLNSYNINSRPTKSNDALDVFEN